MQIQIDNVVFTPSRAKDRPSGLLGFVEFVLNGALRLDSITLRRTRDGRLALSYPSRRDRNDVEHFIVAPLGDDARREVERQVFAALVLEVEG